MGKEYKPIKSRFDDELEEYNTKLITIVDGLSSYMDNENDLKEIFGTPNEVYLVKLMTGNFITDSLKFSDYNEDKDIDDILILRFNGDSNTLSIRKVLMLQSTLWRQSLLKGDISGSDKEFEIPYSVTDRGKEGLYKILSGDIGLGKKNNYFSHFQTIDDAYSYIMVFEYLQLKFVD
jgi:hypothetical protein